MPLQHDEERLRQAAAVWFARRRGPNAAGRQAEFDAWISNVDHARAYERLEQRWSESVILGHAARSRPNIARRPSPRHAGFAPMALALAGLAISALVITVLAWRGPDLGPGFANLDPLARRASTRIGEIKTLPLEGGDSLTLDTDSAVLIRISAREWHVRLLKGRGRFSLEARSAHPLIVDAGEIRVRSAQSTFDVNMTSAQRIEIALLDGAVDIGASPWSAQRRGVSQSHIGLAPGQIVRLTGDQSVMGASAMSALSRGWPSGWLSLDNTPLAEAVAAANRYSLHRIEIGDDRLGALRVTGAFKANAPRRLAAGLAAAFNLQVVEAPDGALKLSRKDI
jgi:transmembrane sensor